MTNESRIQFYVGNRYTGSIVDSSFLKLSTYENEDIALASDAPDGLVDKVISALEINLPIGDRQIIPVIEQKINESYIPVRLHSKYQNPPIRMWFPVNPQPVHNGECLTALLGTQDVGGFDKYVKPLLEKISHGFTLEQSDEGAIRIVCHE